MNQIETPRSAPVRTCVGCRQQDDREALLRFAVRAEEPRLVPDVRRRLPGRGVWVHPRRDCVQRAVRRGGFARALRAQVRLDVDEVCALAAGQYERSLEGLLLAAVRTRAVAIGTDVASRALDDGSARLLWVAEDAAGRRDELVAKAEAAGLPWVPHGTKDALGRLCGRGEVGVLALLDERIATAIAATSAHVIDLTKGVGPSSDARDPSANGTASDAGDVGGDRPLTRRNE